MKDGRTKVQFETDKAAWMQLSALAQLTGHKSANALMAYVAEAMSAVALLPNAHKAPEPQLTQWIAPLQGMVAHKLVSEAERKPGYETNASASTRKAKPKPKTKR